MDQGVDQVTDKLEFDLTVKKDDLGKSLDSNIKKSKTLEDSLSVAVGVLAGNVATKAVEAFGNAISGSIRFVKDSIKAAQVQEDAINSLNAALRVNGKDVEESSRRIQQFASELQKTTKFGDEVTLSATATLQSLANLTDKGLIEGTKAAADLSAALGISLDNAITLVGKAANGEIGAFKRYGIEVEKGASNAQTFTNALDVLNSKFGGAAAAQTETYAGRVAQLGNAFGDFQEELGNIIIKNPAIQEGIKLLTDGIVAFTSTVIDKAPAVIKDMESIVNFLLVTPAKFWVDFFGGKETEGLTEIEASISSLNVKMATLNEFLTKNPKGGILDGTFTTKNEAMTRLAKLIDKEQDLLKKRQDFTVAGGKEFVGPVQGPEDNGALLAKEKTNKELLAKQAQYNADILALQSQLASEETAFNEQYDLLTLDNEVAKNEAKILAIAEQKLRENEVIFQAELAKANLLATEEEKQLAIKKAAAAKLLADTKTNGQKELELKASLVAEEKKLAADRIANQRDTFSTIATLSSANNKTLAAIGKAAGITQIAIDTPVAIGKALSAFPPPFNFAAAGLVGAAMAAQAARIAGVQFQEGGFVGGVNGASIGTDNATASIREGEMILNAQEQQSLMSMLKGGGGAGGDIVIQIDGREIVRAIRRQKEMGMAV
jgi:hypothetical protein